MSKPVPEKEFMIGKPSHIDQDKKLSLTNAEKPNRGGHYKCI